VNVMMSGSRAYGCFVLAVLAVCQSACSMMYPLELAEDGALPAAIEAGDRIRVVDSGGTTTDLVVTSVGGDFIEGTGEGDQPVRIAAAEVQEIGERRMAPGKTIAVGASVGLLLLLQGGTSTVGTMWCC
jgi:hypothetical protein